jgi:UDP-glucose 4-epimerase
MGVKEPVSDRVLITGGFGYLGGRIALDVARQTSWQVCLGSRRDVSSPAWLPEARTVSFDLLNPETFDDALKGVRAVVHLAALNEVESLKFPEQALEVNTLGTLRLLNAAIQKRVERFIYFSTAHVYGVPLAGHITEHSLPKPVHPYAITHHAAERFVLAARDKGAIQGISLRLSNGFGVPAHGAVDRWMLLVNDLCLQAVRDKRLVLRSSGIQQRDFITLHDVGRAVSHFLDLTHLDCSDGLFNLGGECAMSVLAMAERIIKCCRESLGYEPDLVRPQPDANESAAGLNFDIGKLKQTGFVLKGNMDEEIKQTLKMCVSMKQGAKA